MLTMAIAARLSDNAKARVRTLWPYLIGVAATYLVARLHPLGIQIDSATAGVLVAWILGTAVYEAGKWLSHRPGQTRTARVARWAGRWLLSLGLPIQAPMYGPNSHVPLSMVNIERLTPEEAERLKAAWLAQYGGSKNPPAPG